jgi:hypothetical protein
VEDTRRPITDHFPLGPGAEDLSRLLDSLIALRLEIANSTEGEKALTATAGRAKLMEVQATLEKAISDLRSALEATDRRHTSPPRRGDGEQRHEGFE